MDAICRGVRSEVTAGFELGSLITFSALVLVYDDKLQPAARPLIE